MGFVDGFSQSQVEGAHLKFLQNEGVSDVKRWKAKQIIALTSQLMVT